MANVTIPYADPGRASFEEMDTYLQGFLLNGNHPELAPAYGFPMPNSTTFKQFSVLGLDANGKLAMATEGFVAGVSATGTLTFSGAGSAAETVTIGSRTYTLVAASPAVNQVLIGASAAATANNLIAAINGDAGAGTTYGTGTVPHQEVSARLNSAGVVGIVAHDAGTGGNDIATTETGVAIAFGAATLTGGLNAGGVKARFVLAQAATLGASGTANGQCWYQGNFNSNALVWDESFTTDAQKANAFYGAPTPTNIIVAARG